MPTKTHAAYEFPSATEFKTKLVQFSSEISDELEFMDTEPEQEDLIFQYMMNIRETQSVLNNFEKILHWFCMEDRHRERALDLLVTRAKCEWQARYADHLGSASMMDRLFTLQWWNFLAQFSRTSQYKRMDWDCVAWANNLPFDEVKMHTTEQQFRSTQDENTGKPCRILVPELVSHQDNVVVKALVKIRRSSVSNQIASESSATRNEPGKYGFTKGPENSPIATGLRLTRGVDGCSQSGYMPSARGISRTISDQTLFLNNVEQNSDTVRRDSPGLKNSFIVTGTRSQGVDECSQGGYVPSGRGRSNNRSDQLLPNYDIAENTDTVGRDFTGENLQVASGSGYSRVGSWHVPPHQIPSIAIQGSSKATSTAITGEMREASATTGSETGTGISQRVDEHGPTQHMSCGCGRMYNELSSSDNKSDQMTLFNNLAENKSATVLMEGSSGLKQHISSGVRTMVSRDQNPLDTFPKYPNADSAIDNRGNDTTNSLSTIPPVFQKFEDQRAAGMVPGFNTDASPNHPRRHNRPNCPNSFDENIYSMQRDDEGDDEELETMEA